MSLPLSELYQARYKNVNFLATASSTTGGRKDVLHEFPNSDRQTVEDLGLLPRTYTLTAVVTGPNYLSNRDRLLAALEDGETGTLTHPFYGDIENIVCRSYSIEETESSLGEAALTIDFAINNQIGVPVVSGNSLGSIATKNNSVLDDIETFISDNFSINTLFFGNFDAAKEKVLQITDKFDELTDILTVDSEQINEYTARIDFINLNINSLLTSPVQLATSIRGLITSVGDLFATPTLQLDAYRNLFFFGEDDVAIIPDTAGKIERKNNNDTLNIAINLGSLSQGYEVAAQIEFENTRILEEVQEELEIQYQFVTTPQRVQTPTGQTLPGAELPPQIREDIQDLRTETIEFFDQQSLTTSNIVNIRTNTLPARVIAFLLYEDSERGQEIVDLNNIRDVSFVDGVVEVLEQ